MSNLIFIVGLPGSGKSEHIKKMGLNNGHIIYDDFKANSICDNPHFEYSRHYKDLINKLKSGKDCIVSDIDFCKTHSREEAELCIRKHAIDIDIKWIFFENNPEQCKENVIYRSSNSNRNEISDLECINKYTLYYNLPHGSEILKVWSK